ERTDAGPLDVAADAETEIAAVAARHGLTIAERFDAAYRVERLLQGAGIIAAVVDDRLAVAVGNADRVRRRLGGYHVAVTQLGGFEAEMPRDEVDRALHRERSFRPAGAAIGRVRHFVRDD